MCVVLLCILKTDIVHKNAFYAVKALRRIEMVNI